jgi:hypothetical protein
VELLGDIAVILLVARPSPHPLCSDIFSVPRRMGHWCAPSRPATPHAPWGVASLYLCVSWARWHMRMRERRWLRRTAG